MSRRTSSWHARALLPSVSDCLEEKPNSGDTDEEMEATFEERKKARARWTILVRGALQRTLNDIRKYVLDANGRLVPAQKVKIIRVVGTQPRTSQRTPEDDNEEDDDSAWRKDYN